MSKLSLERSTKAEAKKADRDALGFADVINKYHRKAAVEYVNDNPPSAEVIVALVGALGRVTGRAGGRPKKPSLSTVE